MASNQPHVVDNDRDEITVTLDGKEIRGWSYADETECRMKMRMAREFCEGWFQAAERYRGPLEEIRDAHVPDQPAAYGGDELSWCQRHVARLRRIADAALAGRNER